MAIKIAIVDDHPVLLKGLRNILSYAPDIEIIGTYKDGKELLHALRVTQPDVLLLDIQMPGQKGDELAEIIDKQYPDIGIIIFTNLENLYYIKVMIRYIKGYMLKSSDDSILLDAIRTVGRGGQYFDPAIRSQALHILSSSNNITRSPELTQREKEVLELIAKDYNSQEIAHELFISKRTVDSHRINLLLKLDVKNAAGLIKKAIELGLIE